MSRLAAATAAVALLPLALIILVLGTGTSSPGASMAAAPQAAAAATAPAGGGTPAANEALGDALAAAQGWTGPQATCLNELWTRESGWSQTAKNPTTGAYGVAQALGHAPGDTVALEDAGDNYPIAAANAPPYGSSNATDQMDWGLSYIKDTYGAPCGAWAHEVADSSY